MTSVLAPYATSIGMGTPPYGRPLQQVEGRPTLPWLPLMVGHNGPQSAQVKRTALLAGARRGGQRHPHHHEARRTPPSTHLTSIPDHTGCGQQAWWTRLAPKLSNNITNVIPTNNIHHPRMGPGGREAPVSRGVTRPEGGFRRLVGWRVEGGKGMLKLQNTKASDHSP